MQYLKFKWILYRIALTTQVNHLTSLAKWLSVRLQTKWLCVWIPLLSYIVLCLNVFAKLQNARGAFRQPVLMGTSLLVNMCWPYQSTEWFVISPFQVVYRAWDSVATREVVLEMKVDTKYMQINVLRNIAKHDKKRWWHTTRFTYDIWHMGWAGRTQKCDRENWEWWWHQIKSIYRLYLDLVVKQLCCINCLNAWATNCAPFRNQKLCCGTVFLNKNDETKNSSGLYFKA